MRKEGFEEERMKLGKKDFKNQMSKEGKKDLNKQEGKEDKRKIHELILSVAQLSQDCLYNCMQSCNINW